MQWAIGSEISQRTHAILTNRQPPSNQPHSPRDVDKTPTVSGQSTGKQTSDLYRCLLIYPPQLKHRDINDTFGQEDGLRPQILTDFLENLCVAAGAMTKEAVIQCERAQRKRPR